MREYKDCYYDQCCYEDFNIPELTEITGFDVALNNSSNSDHRDTKLLHYFKCSVTLPMCRSPTNVNNLYTMCIQYYILTVKN